MSLKKLFVKIERSITEEKWGANWKNWKTISILIGVIILLTILAILIAESDSLLGRMREGIVQFVSITTSGDVFVAPRSIGEIEFFLNGNIIEDITQPYRVLDSRQIALEVHARDKEGGVFSDDEVLCQWELLPVAGQDVEEKGCRLSYQIGANQADLLVTVTVQGRDSMRVKGMAIQSVWIVLSGDEVTLDE